MGRDDMHYPPGAAGAGAGPDVPLLPGSSPLELRNRPRRDTAWLIAFLVVLGAALGGGIFAFVHRNKNYQQFSPESFTDPKLCPIGSSHSTRRLLQLGDEEPSPFDFELFLRGAGAWLAASIGGSLLVGLLFVWLVKASPRGLVLLALALQVSVPAAMGVVLLLQGGLVAAIMLWVLAGVTLLAFMLWRQQIGLVTELLGVAGRALAAHPGLVPLSLGLQLGGWLLLNLPLLAGMLAGLANGSLAYNTQRSAQGGDGGGAAGGEECRGEGGEQVLCCVWQTEPWVPPYLALAGVAFMWSTFLAFQVKLFTVSGAVAQWYFTVLTGREDQSIRGHSRTLSSLRLALGPSLGSLCCGSAVLTLVAMVRQAMEKARKERGENLLAACAAACLSLLLGLIEYVTRFATVRAAITGEAFFAAGRNVVNLLRRNFMDAFGVWWLPPMILQSTVFVLSACWAVAVALLSYATTWSRQQPPSEGGPDKHPNQAAASAVITAIIALIASWAVLGFLASLLLNVVDVLFVCTAMDRDARVISSPAIYAVFAKLPTVGPVVEQPDGGLAYAAPQQQQHPPPRTYQQV